MISELNWLIFIIIMAKVEEEKERLRLSEPNETNTRKIPKAIFIENVEDFVKKNGGETVQRQMAELYSQYKFMEANMNRQKFGLKSKLPDIQKTLEAVDMLIAKQASENPSFET